MSGGASGDHEEEVQSDLGSPPIVPTQQSGPTAGPSGPTTAATNVEGEQIDKETMRAAL